MAPGFVIVLFQDLVGLSKFLLILYVIVNLFGHILFDCAPHAFVLLKIVTKLLHIGKWKGSEWKSGLSKFSLVDEFLFFSTLILGVVIINQRKRTQASFFE